MLMTKELAIRILSGDVLANTEQTHEAVKMAAEALRERKTGRWIDRGFEGAWNYCSECGEQSIDLYDYCPNCGAKMEEWDEQLD